MKKVALLTDGWKRLIIYAWVAGIMERSGEVDEEICLYHYNSYGNWNHDPNHNQGEYNIFNLPDLRQFDGVILDCNNIREKEQLHHLIEILKDSNVPVVSINYDVEGFYYVGIDNKKPIADMMHHLYYAHGCRSFLFAGGPRDNFENTVRTETYLECLEQFGLAEADNPVWYRDYDFDTGIYYMKQIIEQGITLPDVIVCANDNIAAGICTEAELHGLVAPKDFLITGFDNLDKAAYFQPQITTVNHRREEIGGKSLDILRSIWQGADVEKYHFITTECIFTESCGCPNSRAVDYRRYMKNQITSGVKKDNDDMRLVDLEAEISNSKSFFEAFDKMGDFLQSYDCDGFFIVVDESLLKADATASYAVNGYFYEKLKLVYAKDFKNQVQIYNLEELVAYMDEYGAQSEFLYTPIHFKEQTIGYSILKNGHFLYDNPYYYNIHSILVREMEALYRRQQLENINEQLRDVYNRDQLTGLYNRIAYNEYMEPEFEEHKRAGVVCTVIFADINEFKQINDTYGHKYGDEVIKKVAKLIQDACGEDSYCFRYGGDEFVMLLPNVDEEGAGLLKERLKAAAGNICAGISVGIAVTKAGENKSLQSYVELADKDMYEDKQKNRK